MTPERKHAEYRILLMRPPYTRLRGTGQAPYFPLGIGYLSAVLNRMENVSARIYYPENPAPGERPFVIDKEGVFEARSKAQNAYNNAIEHDDHPVWSEYRRILNVFQPDMLGLSVLTPEVGSALKITTITRQERPSCHIVWGGVHPTFQPEDTLALPGVDFIVTGEGERTMTRLVETLKNGATPSDIPGVLSKNETETPSLPPLIENLDEIPPPDRRTVSFPERYDALALGSIMQSRGCPWRCGFCSSRKFWQERVRFRDPGEVVDEIRRIKKDYGVRTFTFWDDSFTIDRKITEELCERIIQARLGITWRTATRIDLLDDAMLRLMRRAGCVQLELGIETGSPRILELIRKDIDLDRAPDIIERANRSGMACGVFLMAGFPDETERDLEETLAFMKRIRPAEIVLNIFDPMPGSEQYQRTIELGLLPEHPDFTRYPLWPEAHFMKHVDPDMFTRIIERISRYVFQYNTSRTALWRRAKPEVLRLIRTDRSALFHKTSRFIRRWMNRPRNMP